MAQVIEPTPQVIVVSRFGSTAARYLQYHSSEPPGRGAIASTRSNMNTPMRQGRILVAICL